MVRFLLDTNMVSEPISVRPNPAVMAKFRRYEGEMAMSATVWHELNHGWLRLPSSARKDTLCRYLKQLRAKMPIIPYDRRAAYWHAEERARLAKRTPPYDDSQIAAVAAVNDLVLVTANVKHFASLEGVQIENWKG